jgi:polar amino acid transport system substrate-binding protein
MDGPRNVYYLKELPLKISMSYGPGRYDPEYEERGHDYPFAYVRWTEGRNLEAFLDLAAEGRVDIGALTTHRFSIDDGESAYQLISGESKEPYLGIVLNYDTEREVEATVALPASAAKRSGASAIRLGLIGAGGYAKSMLLPNFKANGVEFRSIATSSGVSARDTGERFGFQACAAGADQVISDPETNLIVIATRHDSHADYAGRALAAGKHVFVEKPLAMSDEELDSLLDIAANSPGQLMCGFNRRFSPMAKAAAEFFAGRQHPLSIQYRINCGRIPRESWIQDPVQGGGRIVGEVCHFIDLMHYLTGSVTTRVFAEGVVSRNHEVLGEDSVFVTLRFADGSNGSIAYIAEGDKAMPKERVEIFGGGRNFIIDDFRRSIAYAGGRETVTKLGNQDKGQPNEVAAVCAMVKTGGAAPIALADLAATTRATFRIRESLRTGMPANVG